MKKRIFLALLLICITLKSIAQSGFYFKDVNKTHQKLRFKLINNLIVIPIDINGKQLSFILDTGVNKTILFNLNKNDSIGLNNTKNIKLRGLGKGDAVNALLSKNNTFKIKNIVSYNESIFVILKDYFDLSSKMGTTIHGIIGFNLLKNFIVKVNYKAKRIDFYDPKTYVYETCKKCEVIPFKFYRKKPYIDAKVSLDTIGNKMIDVKLLVDSGGSDAIWLFENSKENIKTPKRYFNDILGEGLSGAIFGNRSRISKFQLGRFEINNPTVSFLDSLSTHNARQFEERNGSVGGGILKRFKIWIDYPNMKFTFKKNGSFTNGFNYNMSGLDVVYNGKQLVREKEVNSFSDNYNQNVSDNNSVSFVTRYSFKFKPSFKIKNVVKNSPADKAGLLKGDIILSINNKPSHQYTIGDIIYKFQERDRKKIKMVIERNGVKMKFEFRLHKSV